MVAASVGRTGSQQGQAQPVADQFVFQQVLGDPGKADMGEQAFLGGEMGFDRRHQFQAEHPQRRMPGTARHHGTQVVAGHQHGPVFLIQIGNPDRIAFAPRQGLVRWMICQRV